MRKLLLLLLAVGTSIGVSAQLISKDAARIQKADLTNVQPKKFGNDAKVQKWQNTLTKMNVKKEGEPSICGPYIYNEIRDDISVSKVDTIKAENLVDTDGTVYNVALRIPGYIFDDFYGTWDEETGILTVPSWQIIYSKETNGEYDCALAGFAGEDYVDAFHYQLQEDGSLELQEDGLSLVIVEEGHQYYGYYILMTEGTRYLKSNAKQISFMNDGSGWPKGDDPNYVDIAFVEDWETSFNVYNFCGYGCVAFNVNEDLTVSVAPGQIVDDYDYTAWGERNGYPYEFGFFMPVAVDVDDDGYLVPNEERPIEGTIEEGYIVALDGYLAIMTHYIQNVGCLRDAYHVNWMLGLDEGQFTAGVREVTASRAERIKNTRTYNLMGQQVDNRTAKGLLIRNGKKYIVK